MMMEPTVKINGEYCNKLEKLTEAFNKIENPSDAQIQNYDIYVSNLASDDSEKQIIATRIAAATAVVASNNIKHIHLHAFGNNFRSLHDLAQGYYEKMQDDADYLFELCLEYSNYMFNPTYATKYSTMQINQGTGFDLENGAIALEGILDQYVNKLRLVTESGVSADVVSKIDDMIRSWDKERKYILHRILLNKKL